MNTIKGAMEGWYEDDLECQGHCGTCEECDNAWYAAGDDYDDFEDN